jgi:hypothetical protein
MAVLEAANEFLICGDGFIAPTLRAEIDALVDQSLGDLFLQRGQVAVAEAANEFFICGDGLVAPIQYVESVSC